MFKHNTGNSNTKGFRVLNDTTDFASLNPVFDVSRHLVGRVGGVNLDDTTSLTKSIEGILNQKTIFRI